MKAKEAGARKLAPVGAREMTRRGKASLAKRKRGLTDGESLKGLDRTACTARTTCAAAHRGAVRERPCVVCGQATLALQVVLAWDVPACLDHDLHRDYRVGIKLNLTSRPTFTATRRIEVAG